MVALSMMVLCRTCVVHAPDAQRISGTYLLSQTPLLPSVMPTMQGTIHAQALMRCADAHGATSLPGPTWQERVNRGRLWGRGVCLVASGMC